MTQLLKKAFNQASKIPEVEQNIFAKWLLEEVIRFIWGAFNKRYLRCQET